MPRYDPSVWQPGARDNNSGTGVTKTLRVPLTHIRWQRDAGGWREESFVEGTRHRPPSTAYAGRHETGASQTPEGGLSQTSGHGAIAISVFG